MLMLAPDLAELWREAGMLHGGSAICARPPRLEQLSCVPRDGRHQAAALLQQLRSKLN